MIVREDQIGSLNFTTPKVILVEVTPSPVARASSTNVVGIVGQFIRGSLNKIYSVGSMPELERKLGGYLAGLDGYLYMKDFFDANGTVAKIVRVASSGTASASGVIYDETSGTVELMTFVADSVGTWGNGIVIDVTSGTIADYFNITIRNTGTQEVRTYNKVTTDSADSRYIATIVNKDAGKFFNLTVHVDDGTMPESGSTTMTGGSNGDDTGTSLPSTAYVGTESGGTRTGIQLFKSQIADDVSIVISARNDDTINTGLITHVNDIKLSPRRTVITFAEGTTVEQAIGKMATLDNDKVKVVYPYVYVQNIFSGESELHNPTAFDGANDSLLSYHLSASQTQYPATVQDLEIDMSPTDIDTLTAKRVNPIVLRIGRGFIRASDYTTSSNPSLAQNTVRKAKDFFARSFYDVLQFYISKPITPKLWASIRDSLIAFLKTEASAGRIGRPTGGAPYGVLCDSTNNPQEIVQLNKVIVLVEISLLAPADIIQVFLDAQQDKTIVNA